MHQTLTPRPLASLPPAPAPRRFNLQLIGGFALHRFGEPVELPTGAQRLLGYLALQARPVSRQRVAGTFWPETSDERALANLRSALWRLNRPDSIVVASGDAIAIAPDVGVDVHAMGAFARSVLDDVSAPDGELVEELAAATELLPDWSDEWALVERERFRQLRLHALEQLCGQLASAGRYGRAVEVCLVAVSSEPLRESAQRELMKVHLAEGNVVEAFRQYEAFRILLLDELGVEPSTEMADLLDRSGVAVPVRLEAREERRSARPPAGDPAVEPRMRGAR